MADDGLLIVLLNEAVNGSTRPQRIAAKLLLDLLLNDPSDEAFKGKQEVVEAKETAEVVMELRALIDQHGLGG